MNQTDNKSKPQALSSIITDYRFAPLPPNNLGTECYISPNCTEVMCEVITKFKQLLFPSVHVTLIMWTSGICDGSCIPVYGFFTILM